ncbi:Ig-like domain-containing protein [Gottfriedia acidiceleris]|uniref:Ig-like domain-containing protein n=1 Tax=Gottfriedia acidiceleris TaxID=371036 RepID=UPI002FFF852D
MKTRFYLFVLIILFLAQIPNNAVAETVDKKVYSYTGNDTNEIDGQLNSFNEIHRYEITPETSGEIAVYSISPIAKSSAYFYDENDKLVDVVRNPSVFTVTKGKMYALEIRGPINIDYPITYQYKIILPTDQPTWNQVYEPNDVKGLAYPLQSGEAISGYIEDAYDRDVYKITVEKSGELFAAISGVPQTLDYRIRLQNEDGSKRYLDDSKTYGHAIDELVEPGTYYLTVTPVNSNHSDDVDYKLEVSFPTNDQVSPDSEGEPNNTRQQATELLPDVEYHASFTNSFDVDWYKVSVPERTRVVLDTQSADVEIVNSNFYSSVSTNENYPYDGYLLPGTYYVKVNRKNDAMKNGMYTIRRTDVPESDEWTNGKNPSFINFDQVYDGKMDYLHDLDFYSIPKVDRKGILQLRFRSNFKEQLDLRMTYYLQPTFVREEGDETVYTYFIKENIYPYKLTVQSPNGEYGRDKDYNLKATFQPYATVDQIYNNGKTVSGQTLPNVHIHFYTFNPLEAHEKLAGVGESDENGHFTDPIQGHEYSTYLRMRIDELQVLNGNTGENEQFTPIIDMTIPTIKEVEEMSDRTNGMLGKGEPYSTITFTANGKIIATTTVKEDETYFINYPIQKAGTIVSIQAKDHSGNVSPPIRVTVKDKTPPAKPVKPYASDFEGKVTGKGEPGVTVLVYSRHPEKLIGSDTVSSNGNYVVKIPKQKAGTELYLRFKDKGGNYSAPAYLIVIDKTPPTFTMSKKIVKTKKWYMLSGKTQHQVEIEVRKGSKLIAHNWSSVRDAGFNLYIPPQKKGQIVTIIAKDLAGNKSKPLSFKIN